jgi:hypothetical protein
MGFREQILERFKIRAREPVTREIDPLRMQAFTRKELETGVNLYLHLNALGHTFADLIEFLEQARRNESTARVQSAVNQQMILTREQRKHLKKGGGRRRN